MHRVPAISRSVAFTLLAFVVAAIGGPLAAQERGRVTGRVVAQGTGRGLEAVQVILVPGGRTVLTDVDGTFALGNVTPGRYRLRALRPGYAVADVELEVSPGSAVVALIMQVTLATHH